MQERHRDRSASEPHHRPPQQPAPDRKAINLTPPPNIHLPNIVALRPMSAPVRHAPSFLCPPVAAILSQGSRKDLPNEELITWRWQKRETSGDPVIDLQNRLERLECLRDMQRGRVQHDVIYEAKLLGAPRLYDGWSSRLARKCAMQEYGGTDAHEQAPKVEPHSKLRGYAAPDVPKSSTPPTPEDSFLKREDPTVLQKARWARVEEQMREFMYSPKPSFATNADPRGREVCSWPLAAALDALPSDVTRNKDFRLSMTATVYGIA